MKKSLLPTLLIPLLLGPLTEAAGGNDWSYSGKTGPKNWGNINENYTACLQGKNQSPVNITNTIKADLRPITFNYNIPGKYITTNGHSAKLIFDKAGSLTLRGHKYSLRQVNFHTPSEHHISGNAYSLEAHFVHTDKKGKVAVVAVMFKKGKRNRKLDPILKAMPRKVNKTNFLGNVSAIDLLPKTRDYYRYNGSLTTPPCSEGVVWLVLKQPISVSKKQLKKFKKVLHHSNKRPVQPINSRIILK